MKGVPWRKTRYDRLGYFVCELNETDSARLDEASLLVPIDVPLDKKLPRVIVASTLLVLGETDDTLG